MIRRHLTKYLFLIITLVAVVTAPASAFTPQGISPLVPEDSRELSDLQSPIPGSGEDLEWYSTQLHLHGWSNHNAGNQPGSIQLHTKWAQETGVDVLWWKEHNSTFHQVNDFLVDLTGATVDPTTLAVSIPLPPGTPPWAVYDYVTQLVPAFVGQGQAAASLSQGRLRMEIQADGNSMPDVFSYEARTTEGFKVGGQTFSRPIASDPLLSFDAARCDSSGAQAYGQVTIDLSWHDYGSRVQQKLVYRLVAADQPADIVHSATTVTVTVPLTATQVNLPLLAHASLLPDGDDNSVLGLRLAVGAQDQAAGCMEVGSFNFHSRVATPAELVQKHQEVSHRHEVTYGVKQLTTWEQFAGLRHLNPFLPSSATLLPGLNDIQVENFVPLIHSYHGLVGLNHPFGVQGGALLPPEQQEARLQGFLDIMLPVHAWNVDLIEIYKNRGQTDLNHHLRLWDLLGVNGIELCANAASDQHGGAFFDPAYMLSWLEAPSTSQDDLLDALRRCRVSFGDIRKFDGVLDLRLGSAPMGGTYPMHAGTAQLNIIVDPLPPGAQVKLVQYRDIPARDLSYMVDHEIVDPAQPITVDVSEASMLRVEVWTQDGQLAVLSNRIYVRDVNCDVNGSGSVTIADIQSVSAVIDASVPPAPAAADLHTDGIIDIRDIIAAGACWQAAHAALSDRQLSTQ